MRILSLALSLAAALAAAENPTGRWEGLRPMGPGRTEPITFRFQLSSGVLTGSLQTGYGELPLLEPSWDGREFRFLSRMVFRPYRVTDEYRGVIEGGEMKWRVLRNGREPREGTARRVSAEPEPYVRSEPVSTPPAVALPPDGLAATPPMGWSSWNHFADRIDGETIRQIADALVKTGLRDAGYVYVNIDDGWTRGRNAAGEFEPTERMGSIKALADYVHARGLKLGIYSAPGPATCAGYTGSWGHEEQDARTFAAWGIDYLKYDWCSGGLVWPLARMGDAYQMMARALRATGRPIVLSICQYGLYNVQEWGAAAGGHLWRTTGDIGNSWGSLAGIAFNQHGLEQYAGPGRWNDPDMLEIGNGGLTAEEERSHFTLWAMLAAPLLLGNDVRKVTPETLALLLNKEVIAVDQDKLGRQGRRVAQKGQVEIWTRPLAGGEWAIALFNRGSAPAAVPLNWAELGIAQPVVRARDLWSHTDVEEATATAPLAAHGCALFRVKTK